MKCSARATCVLNREVAIKVLPKDFANDSDRLRRFEQEAKSLAALNDPNILTIHDAGVHDGAPYLVSELLEGKTLREELGNNTKAAFPVRKATDYALQIAQGLAAAHGKGITHRDLKPENIFRHRAERQAACPKRTELQPLHREQGSREHANAREAKLWLGLIKRIAQTDG